MERKKLIKIIILILAILGVALLAWFIVKSLLETKSSTVDKTMQDEKKESREQEADKQGNEGLTPGTEPDGQKSASESANQANDIKDFRTIGPPPVHSNILPSANSPAETVEALLEVAKTGNSQFFVDFLNYEARNDPSIQLIPSGWNASKGGFVVGDPTKGEANTLNVLASFYQDENTQGTPFEKMSYHLVFSFERWLIYETAYER